MNRGTSDHPFRSIKELTSGIIGKTNCTLYTYGTWELPKELIEELKIRNIKLLGVMVAYIDCEKVVMPIIKSLSDDLINGINVSTPKGIVSQLGGK